MPLCAVARSRVSPGRSVRGVLQAAVQVEARAEKVQACKGLSVFLVFLLCYVTMLKLQLNIEDAYVRRPQPPTG